MEVSIIKHGGKEYALSAFRLAALVDARADAVRLAEHSIDGAGRDYYTARAQALLFVLEILESPVTH